MEFTLRAVISPAAANLNTLCEELSGSISWRINFINGPIAGGIQASIVPIQPFKASQKKPKYLVRLAYTEVCIQIVN